MPRALRAAVAATTTTASPTPVDKFPSLTSKPLRMSYRIARGEQGVLTFEPYKSLLLPHWRFRTPSIARTSSSTLWTKFLEYHDAGDFVGMDMARKFIQMGMTRAARYANYKGGRKYARGREVEMADGKRKYVGEGQFEKSEGHEGMVEKREASDVFRAVWQRCRGHEGYKRLKEEFLREQKEWDKQSKKEEKGVKKAVGKKGAKKEEEEKGVKKEEEEE